MRPRPRPSLSHSAFLALYSMMGWDGNGNWRGERISIRQKGERIEASIGQERRDEMMIGDGCSCVLSVWYCVHIFSKSWFDLSLSPSVSVWEEYGVCPSPIDIRGREREEKKKESGCGLWVNISIHTHNTLSLFPLWVSVCYATANRYTEAACTKSRETAAQQSKTLPIVSRWWMIRFLPEKTPGRVSKKIKNHTQKIETRWG